MSTQLIEPATSVIPVWRLSVASFLPADRRAAALSGWIPRLPLVAVLVAQVLITLRLSNSAFDDEGLYIEAGHAYLDHLLHGTAIPVFGTYFSGTPMAYPVLAAVLDSVGGLWLVRAVSLLAMIVTTLCIYGTTRHIWNQRAAGLAAACFALAGPVTFIGAFATFDAVTVWLLAVAVYVGVRGRSYRSALVVGAALALAVICKYTAAAFVPVVLALVTVASAAAQRSPNGASGRQRTLLRSTLAGAVAVVVPGALYAAFGSSLRDGIAFTTSSRAALSPVPITKLVHFLALDVGGLAVLAVLGALLAAHCKRSLGTVLCLLAGSALLPLAQMRLGEEVSFEKHLAYSAVFLAPLAGRGLLWVYNRKLGVLAVFLVLFIVGANGLSRSNAMYEIWPPVDRVLELVADNGQSGAYFSTSARTLGYYTRHDFPGIHWDEQYGLYGGGNAAIRKVVTDRTYEMVVLRSKFTGAAGDDAHTSYFISLLDASRDYELVTKPFQTRPYAPDKWLVYRRVAPPAAAPPRATAQSMGARPLPTRGLPGESAAATAAQEQLWTLVRQFASALEPVDRTEILRQIDVLTRVPGVIKSNPPAR